MKVIDTIIWDKNVLVIGELVNVNERLSWIILHLLKLIKIPEAILVSVFFSTH